MKRFFVVFCLCGILALALPAIASASCWWGCCPDDFYHEYMYGEVPPGGIASFIEPDPNPVPAPEPVTIVVPDVPFDPGPALDPTDDCFVESLAWLPEPVPTLAPPPPPAPAGEFCPCGASVERDAWGGIYSVGGDTNIETISDHMCYCGLVW